MDGSSLRQLAAAREELVRLRRRWRAVIPRRRPARSPRPNAAMSRHRPEAPPDASGAGGAPAATAEPRRRPGTEGHAAARPLRRPRGRARIWRPGVEAVEERLARPGPTRPADRRACGRAGAERRRPRPQPPPGNRMSLTVTFEVNSSHLPGRLDSRLRRLAEGLGAGPTLRGPADRERGHGPGDQRRGWARGGSTAGLPRADGPVAEFLRENADADAAPLIRADSAGDPSRRVVVQVRPVP